MTLVKINSCEGFIVSLIPVLILKLKWTILIQFNFSFKKVTEIEED